MRKFYAVFPTWNAVRSELIFFVAVYVDGGNLAHACAKTESAISDGR